MSRPTAGSRERRVKHRRTGLDLRRLTPLQVTNPQNGRSVIFYKRDIGAGHPPLNTVRGYQAGREDSDPNGVGDRPGQELRQGPRPLLRPVRAVGDHQRFRHHQHLVLAEFERTRELGMLRAVRMSRRQMPRMIRQESIVTALIGAPLNLPLNVLLARLTTRALGSLGTGFHLPGQQLAGFVVLAVMAGIGATALPAHRAARLNVLQALQYE